nr:odorant binding protein 15 [Pachyrhinus yasumatsui]
MIKVALLVLSAIAIIVYCDFTPEAREEMFRIQNECMKETGATDEMVMNAFAGTFSDAPELAEQLICVGKRNGMVDEEGHIHKEGFKSKLMMVIDDEARVNEVLDKCLIAIGTLQETAITVAKCLFAEFHG